MKESIKLNDLDNNNQINEKEASLDDKEMEILDKKNRISDLENDLKYNDDKKELYTLSQVDREIQKSARNDENFIKFLKYFDCEKLTKDIEKINKEVFRTPIEELGSISLKLKDLNIDKIPSGYGFKGGAARYILLLKLGLINEKDSPRDYDLIRLGKDNSKDKELAEIFCPEDLENGHGVEKLEKNYFKTRDFIFNEVYTDDSYIYFSKQCILDLIRRIIRFSEFEKEENFDNKNKIFINDKLIAKACRLLAIYKTNFDDNARIANTEILDTNMNAFHIALHLDRALENGTDVGIQYIKELYNLKFIFLTEEEINNPLIFIKKFINENKNDFHFNGIPRELLIEMSNDKLNLENKIPDNDLDNLIEDANSYFDSSSKYSSKKYKV